MVVSGAMVKLGSYTTTTDTRGNFQFINADVPKDFYELANLFQIYIQVDTKSNPNGEIRGLFYLFSEYMFSVVATGDQVVPKVNSGGVGIGTVRISLPLSSLEYEISAFSLSGRVKSASILSSHFYFIHFHLIKVFCRYSYANVFLL